jgi:hypothetical protein
MTITMVSYGVKFSWYIFLALFSPYFQLFGYELELLVVSIPMKCNGSDQFGLFKGVVSSTWMNNYGSMCDANGYGEFGNCSTLKYVTLCHYSRRWQLLTLSL